MRKQNRPEWFLAYVAAMLEEDKTKVRERVTAAEQAIRLQISRLQQQEMSGTREILDLHSASKHLELLAAIPSI